MFGGYRTNFNLFVSDLGQGDKQLGIDGERQSPFGPSTQGLFDELYKWAMTFEEYAVEYGMSDRLANLKTELLQIKDQMRMEGKLYRGIIFVQERITAHVLKYFISEIDTEINDGLFSTEKPYFFRCGVLYSSSTPASGSFRLSKSEQEKVLRDFSSGELNLIVSTNVSEEGMDVPEANSVIRFDPVQTPVSYIQGRGRARQEGSHFSSIVEVATKSSQLIEAVQDIQYTQLRTIIQKKSPDSPIQRKEMSNTLSPEWVLVFDALKRDQNQQAKNPLGFLNEMKQRCPTIIFEDEYTQTASGMPWTCRLSMTLGGSLLDGKGTSQTKKNAKTDAALALLEELRRRSGK